ncbi:MAG: hypothetical protein ACXVHJ_23635 [Solirubrobacteraceae bacterium]
MPATGWLTAGADAALARRLCRLRTEGQRPRMRNIGPHQLVGRLQDQRLRSAPRHPRGDCRTDVLQLDLGGREAGHLIERARKRLSGRWSAADSSTRTAADVRCLAEADRWLLRSRPRPRRDGDRLRDRPHQHNNEDHERTRLRRRTPDASL